MTLRRVGLIFANAFAAIAFAACGTVDPGPPPAEVNACRPSRQFFVDQIWPGVFDKDYPGNKRCSNAGCHDANSGRQMVLPTPTSAWPPPLPLPDDWERIYKSIAEQMICTNVDSSPLLQRIDGREKHGGGILIGNQDPEAMLIRQWVSAP